MAERVDAPFRFDERSIGRREDDPRRPERERDHARIDGPDPHAVRRLVPATCHDRRSDRKAGGLSGRPCDGPGHLGTFRGPRQPARIDAEGGQDLRGPVPGRKVEQERAGAVGSIDRVLASEPVADEVLRQPHVRDACPHLGLVLAYPEQLRRRKPGQGIVAGHLDEPLPADELTDLVALG